MSCSSSSSSSASQASSHHAPNEESRFWRMLCANQVKEEIIEGTCESEAASWLHLDEDAETASKVCWLGNPLYGSHLYVRNCYRKLYAEMLRTWDEARPVLMLGVAGIGKSTFRSLIIYEFVREKLSKNESFSVLLDSNTYEREDEDAIVHWRFMSVVHPDLGNRDSFCYCLSRNQVYGITRELFSRQTPNHHLLYIADDRRPSYVGKMVKHVRLLQISPFRYDVWRSFRKRAKPRILYMPSLTRTEMVHLMKHIQIPNVIGCSPPTVEEVKERYRKLGGSITNVLMLYHVSADVLIHSELYRNPLQKENSFRRMFSGASYGLAEYTSSLLHFHVNHEAQVVYGSIGSSYPSRNMTQIKEQAEIYLPFQRVRAMFASDYIQAQVFRRFAKEIIRDLTVGCHRSDSFDTIPNLDWHIFAAYVHARIQKPTANQCKFRKLDDHSATEASVSEGSSPSAVVESYDSMKLSSLSFVEFDSLQELKSMEISSDTYAKPINRSYGAIEFIIGRTVIGNMTRHIQHGISILALYMLNALGYTCPQPNPPVVQFLWIMPNEILFNKMRKIPLVYEGRIISLSNDASMKIEGTSSITVAAASSPSNAQNPPLISPSPVVSAIQEMSAGQQKLIELNQLVQFEQLVILMKPPRPSE